MSAEDFDDLNFNVSLSDIALAASKVRRKSIRRSMMVIPTMSDSPISCSSPKTVVRRKSVGNALRSIYATSFIPTPASRQSPPFADNQHKITDVPPDQSLSLPPPETKGGTDVPVSVCSHPHSVENHPIADPFTQSPDLNSSKLNRCLKTFTSTESKFPPDSVNALFENYERELAEWPKYLERLEHEIPSRLHIPFLDRADIMENSMLSPFAEFIFMDKPNPMVREMQRRTKSAYFSVMASLIRAKLFYKKLKYIVAALERQNEILKDAKLRELLPDVVLNRGLLDVKDILTFIPCLRESEGT